VAASTLVRVRDSEISIRPLGALGAPTRAAPRTRVATWASGDTIPALSRRAAELEALAKSLQTDLDRARERLAAYSEFDQPLERALVDAYRSAEAIGERARLDANATFERALDERRLVFNDLDHLRSERDDLTNEIAFARRGRLMQVRALRESAPAPVPDHRAVLAAEMRLILGALLKETLGPRPAPAKPRTAVHPPRTLLRAPLLSARKRRESPPLRGLAPTPSAAAIVQATVEDIAAQETGHAVELAGPIAPLARTGVEVVEEIAAVIETPTDLNRTHEAAPAMAPALGEDETLAIRPSGGVLAGTEADSKKASDEAVESVQTNEDRRAIALKLVEEASAAMRDIVPETAAEPPLELALDEPTLSISEPSEPAPELAVAQQIDVLRAGPIQAREMVEPVVLPPPPLVAEPEPVMPIAPDAITDMWDTALGAMHPDHDTPEPSLAPFASPNETAAEPAPAQAQSLITESAPHVDAPPVIENATSASPMAPPLVAPRGSVRELQLVLSPITSFPQLLAIQHRIASLSSVNALQLRDFRNGVATFAAGVTETLSGREFGSVLQMAADLGLRVQGATENSVELRVEPQAL
jgi:hypothetical protein